MPFGQNAKPDGADFRGIVKTVQSFELGWRNIPVHVDRQILLILALKSRAAKKGKPCWLTRQCPAEDRENCPAHQFDAGNLCWFINGTYCKGTAQVSWPKKMKICRGVRGLPIYFATENMKGRNCAQWMFCVRGCGLARQASCP
jgi:hypothetical protein